MRFVALALLGASLALPALADPEGLALRYADGRLSAHLEQVPLADVLLALERETGAEIHGEIHTWSDVSASFDGLPLSEGVERLLGTRSFVLRYDRDGQPLRLEVMPAAPARTPADAVSAPAAPLPVDATPVALPPELARIIGTPRPTLARLLGRIRRQTDPAVRERFWGVLRGVIESDAGLRHTVMGADPEALGRTVQAWAGAYADELLRHLALRAADPLLRARAAATRGRLATPAPPS